MNTFSKILVTIAVIVVWLILSVLNNAIRQESGHQTPGIIGMVLLIGMIGAIRAVWKKKGDKNDSSTLQK
ncbi:MAG: hypothetical protein NC115_05345 [Bacteroidales bacterium]|nr:hypothetical protein [Bacteroidales bacterium]